MNWLRQKIVHRVVLALFLLGMSAIPIPVFAGDQDFFDYARERANQGAKEVLEADTVREKAKAVGDCIVDICSKGMDKLKQQSNDVLRQNSSNRSRYEPRNYSSGSQRGASK